MPPRLRTQGTQIIIKGKIATIAVTSTLGLSVALTGCSSEELKTSGYQGELDNGESLVYLEMGDGTVMVSITDDDKTGEDADAYSGKAEVDAKGKTTVTDEESGKKISLTITENEDCTADAEVDQQSRESLRMGLRCLNFEHM